MKTPREWSPAQERAATYLAGGLSVKAAADRAGIGRSTLHGWLRQSGYREHVSALRGRIVTRAVGALARASTKATAVMERLLDSPDGELRLKAAKGILENLVRLRANVEMQEQVEAINMHLQAIGSPMGGGRNQWG